MARTPPKMAPIKGKCCTVALIYKTKQKTVSFFFFLTLSVSSSTWEAFYWHNGLGNSWTLTAFFWKAGAWLQWPVKSRPNEKTGGHIGNRCECTVVENSAQKQKRWPEKHCCMNAAYCAGPCVFDGDGCVHIEGGYDSLHPLDQWLGFGQQPSPWYWDHHTQTFPNSHLLSISTHAFESLKRFKILQT